MKVSTIIFLVALGIGALLTSPLGIIKAYHFDPFVFGGIVVVFLMLLINGFMKRKPANG